MACYALNLGSIPILDIEIDSNGKLGHKKGISNALTPQDESTFSK